MALVGIHDCVECGQEVGVSCGERGVYSYHCRNPRCGSRHVYGRNAGIAKKLRPLVDEEPAPVPAPKAAAPTPKAAPAPAAPVPAPAAKPSSPFSWRNK